MAKQIDVQSLGQRKAACLACRIEHSHKGTLQLHTAGKRRGQAWKGWKPAELVREKCGRVSTLLLSVFRASEPKKGIHMLCSDSPQHLPAAADGRPGAADVQR